jgi:thioredoxin 1
LPDQKEKKATTVTGIIMAIEITDTNFDELVLKSDKPVVIDFWAEWCGPCRMVGPIVEEIGNDFADKAVVGKLDVDSNPGITARFGIRNIPTVLFFKNGDIVDKQVGAVPKSNLVSKLEAIL